MLLLGGREVALKPIARKARHADFDVVVFGIHTDVLDSLCLSRKQFEPFLEGVAQRFCHLVPSTFSIVLQDGLDGINETDEALLF